MTELWLEFDETAVRVRASKLEDLSCGTCRVFSRHESSLHPGSWRSRCWDVATVMSPLGLARRPMAVYQPLAELSVKHSPVRHYCHPIQTGFR